MIQFLASFFIRDSRNYKSPEVRQAYGVLSGAVGIGLNIFLFFGKWIAGIRSIRLDMAEWNIFQDFWFQLRFWLWDLN